MAKKKYPGVEEAELLRSQDVKESADEVPDFTRNAPNYDKFKGWSVEEVLVWLNTD